MEDLHQEEGQADTEDRHLEAQEDTEDLHRQEDQEDTDRPHQDTEDPRQEGQDTEEDQADTHRQEYLAVTEAHHQGGRHQEADRRLEDLEGHHRKMIVQYAKKNKFFLIFSLEIFDLLR